MSDKNVMVVEDNEKKQEIDARGAQRKGIQHNRGIHRRGSIKPLKKSKTGYYPCGDIQLPGIDGLTLIKQTRQA